MQTDPKSKKRQSSHHSILGFAHEKAAHKMSVKLTTVERFTPRPRNASGQRWTLLSHTQFNDSLGHRRI